MLFNCVMPDLVPGIHVLSVTQAKDVDGRDKPGHDVISSMGLMSRSNPAGPSLRRRCRNRQEKLSAWREAAHLQIRVHLG